MTTDFRKPYPGPKLSDPIISGFLMAWSVAAIVLSIVWPRYGFFGAGALKATPFTLLATLTWLVLPLTLAFDPVLRSQMIRAVLRRRFIMIAILVWYIWRLLTAFLGEDFIGSLTFLMRQVVYLVPLLFLTLFVCRGPNGRQRMVTLIVLSTALVIIAGYFEFITHKTVSQLSGLQFAGETRLLNILAQSNTRPGAGAIRLQSVFFHPIVFAQYLAWAAPMLLYAATSRRSIIIRAIAAVCFAAAPFFILKTDARSGLLAFGVAMTLYAGLLIIRRTGIFSFQAAFAAAVVLALTLAGANAGQSTIGGMFSGRNASEASSTQARGAMFERGFDEIKRSPLIGFGDNRSPEHAGLRGRFGILTIDSAYLSALLDTGWIGIVILSVTWIGALITAVRVAMSRAGSSLDAAVAAGLLAVLAVFSVLSIMENVSLIFVSIAMTLGTWPSTLSAARSSMQRAPGDATVRTQPVAEKPRQRTTKR